jgi:hypothetical protein
MIIALPLLATLSACSGTENGKNETIEAESEPASAAEAAADATAERSGGAVFTKPAAVSPGVAPGVAFQYQYDFRLPATKIEAVQDEHAAACERLGLSRCQITGFSFQQNEDRDPSGQMQFMLDPAIARQFGRDALASVEKADGVLATSNVMGDNVGADIASSQVRSAGLEAEVNRIEERLAGKGLANDERVELRNRAEELREILRNEKDSRREGEKRLATTPVVFNYSANMGIGAEGSFGDALAASTSSMATMLSMLMLLLAIVLPWLLPIAAIVLLVRSPLGAGIRHWWNKSSPLSDGPMRD